MAARGKKPTKPPRLDRFDMAMTFRSLAMLMELGTPLPDAVETTIEGSPEGGVKKAMEKAWKAVKTGETVATAFKGAGFPPIVVYMVAAGEETGKLDEALSLLGRELERGLRHGDGPDLGGQARSMAHRLAMMMALGIPLVPAVQVVAEMCEHPGLAKALKKSAEDMKAGLSFSEALEKHPAVIGPVFLGCIKAGEQGRNLDIALQKMAGLGDSLLELQCHRGEG
jgi:type II secretory pathway component PulF